MNLTAAQIQSYAANAGFTGSDIATAAAIALAESSGNPSAVGDTALAPANGPSYGLWQINIGSNANPQYANLPLTDPQTNANVAFAMFAAAGGFGPWSTYTNGAYTAYLPPTSTPATASAFAPATGILTLPNALVPAAAPAIDWGTIALVFALGFGVLFAFSEA